MALLPYLGACGCSSHPSRHQLGLHVKMTWKPTLFERYITRFGTTITSLHWRIFFHDLRNSPETETEEDSRQLKLDL